jgi:uncharacterized protein (DUF2336 family)
MFTWARTPMLHTYGNLEQLVDLARESSSDKRRELLRRMTDLFASAPETFGAREAQQFGEILADLAFSMEMEVRYALATRLASIPNAPANLIRRLANDEIVVARPVLAESLALSEADLVALAKLKSQDHLHAIAGRKAIGEALADALIARGSDHVLARLAGNAGAELTADALEKLADRAQSAEVLHFPLVNREGLPPHLLAKLFFAVSSSLKQTILQTVRGIDPAMVDEAIRQAERRVAPAAGPDRDQEEADEICARFARTGSVTESLLVTLARQKRWRDMTAVFARLTTLDIHTAGRVLNDPNPEALAIAARACRFDRSTFSILVLERRTAALSVNETYDLVGLYDRIPPEAAQRVMRFWRIRQGSLESVAA